MNGNDLTRLSVALAIITTFGGVIGVGLDFLRFVGDTGVRDVRVSLVANAESTPVASEQNPPIGQERLAPKQEIQYVNGKKSSSQKAEKVFLEVEAVESNSRNDGVNGDPFYSFDGDRDTYFSFVRQKMDTRIIVALSTKGSMLNNIAYENPRLAQPNRVPTGIRVELSRGGIHISQYTFQIDPLKRGEQLFFVQPNYADRIEIVLTFISNGDIACVGDFRFS